MIIYKITNKINGKIYIGQTEQTLEKRWNKHVTMSRYGRKHNRLTAIGAAIKKYGKENFIIEQIDSAENEKELCDKEKYYAELLNSYVPNGYNIAECGKQGNTRRNPKSRRLYVFVSPDNKIVETGYLKKFCKENNLKYRNMCALFQGKRFYYGGWRNARVRNKVWTVRNLKTGDETDIHDSIYDVEKKAKLLGIDLHKFKNFLLNEESSCEHLVMIKIFYVEIPEKLKSIKIEKKICLWDHGKVVDRASSDTALEIVDNKNLIIYKFKNTFEFSKYFNLSHNRIRFVLGISYISRKRYEEWSSFSNRMKRQVLVSPDGEEFGFLYGNHKKFFSERNIKYDENYIKLYKGKIKEYNGWKFKKSYIPSREEYKIIDLNF